MKVKKLLLSVVSVAMAITAVHVIQNNKTNDLQESTNHQEVIEGNSSVSLSKDSPITGEDVIIDLVNNKLQEDKKENNYLVDDGKDEVVNEKGEIKVPFDQAYPEIFEEGDIAYSKETLMIKFAKSFDGTVNKSLKDAGVLKLEKMFDLEDASWYTAYVGEKEDIHETIADVREMNNVIVAEYNFAYETTLESVEDWDTILHGNSEYKKQWHRKHCDIEKAWQHGKNETAQPGGSSSVVVAVIDTGVDYNHVDLANNIWKNTLETPNNGYDDDGNGYVDDYYGVDMTKDYNHGSGLDDHGHGTHVAGIIAAENNKTGVVGLAYNTKIMPIKAGDASGYFLQNDIANAVLYAVNNGADVINMSFGGTASSIAVQDALALAYNRCVLVASAGNDGEQNELLNENRKVIPNYPAALSYVIGVMSVGEDNVESAFTNYDAYSFNAVEYEVYAPGESIISTIPGDKYATMSGTSMAAPVVAAQAALLRSFYTDRNTYPTKFIYGQIVGTADEIVECLDPANHLDHYIPGVVNFYDSMVELPKPNVGMSDFTIFDTEGLDQDTAGKNNGDGIVDSGETFALGFTLRNQWGMSKDTVVSISTENGSGIQNQYVTILNNDINYGEVGTYSEKDSGKTYTEDKWTGWQNPFYIHVSEKCPNDYSITLYLTISYKNGLDTSDRTNYVSDAKILLKVKNGVIVPYYIAEDTVLTKDNYYIIPTAVTIAPNATLKVEPGTKIQFWTNDPEDSYAETAIVDLTVNGNFICEGTEEEPIEIFPSEWLSDYAVIIKSTDKYQNTANITLKHTKIVNPIITGVTLLENCELTQNYDRFSYKYRHYDQGKVVTNTYHHCYMSADVIKGTSFYKLGGYYSYQTYEVRATSLIEECIFVDSYVDVKCYDGELINNVFYGNNNYPEQNTDSGGTSTVTTNTVSNEIIIEDFFALPEIGNTYLKITTLDENKEKEILPKNVVGNFINNFGGEWISFNSKEEANEIIKKITIPSVTDPLYGYRANIQKNVSNNLYLNDNGTVIPNTVTVETESDVSENIAFTSFKNNLFFYENSEGDGYKEYGREVNGTYIWSIRTVYDLIEIPALYPVNITLPEYITNLEVGDTYQIHATTSPNNKVYPLVYTSMDENVATVDENGLVTTVGAGTTNIRVYSEDLGTYNYLTVNVSDKVELENIFVENEVIYMSPNETLKLKVNFYPSNTTQRDLTYVSTDESVVKVNEYGYVQALKVGEAVIIIDGENDALAAIQIIVSNPATTLYYDEDIYYTNLEEDDGDELIPNTDLTLDLIEWSSSDPEVCYVTESGYLVKRKEGFATIRAEDKNSGLYDDIGVVINHNVVAYEEVVKIVDYNNIYYMLTSNGEVWSWDTNKKTYPSKVDVRNVKDIALHASNGFMYLTHEGEVYTSSGSKIAEGISKLQENEGIYTNLITALGLDGNVYYLYYGVSGKADLTNVNGKVIDIVKADDYIYLLTDEGYLYSTYHEWSNTSIPGAYTLLDANVIDIYENGSTNVVVGDKNEEIVLYRDGTVYSKYAKEFENVKHDNSYGLYYIENGRIFFPNNETITKNLSSLNTIQSIYNMGSALIIQTIDKKIYAYGSASSIPIYDGSASQKPQRIVLGINGLTDTLNYVSDNVEIGYPTLQNVGVQSVGETDFTDYVAISTKEDLININNDLDGKYYLTNDIEFTEDDYKEGGILYKDAWLPIGMIETNDEYIQNIFTGVFDGNGHTIKGLIKVNSHNGYQYSGLFGYLEGQIRNLTVDFDFTCLARGATGAIVGEMYGENALIENCISKGTIKARNVSTGTGGIVGVVELGTVQACENYAEINYDPSSLYFCNGGIASRAENANIISCVNYANISSDYYGGGIVGDARYTTIDQCINKGNITAYTELERSDYYYIGGIVGRGVGSTISNSYSSGAMIDRLADASYESKLYMGQLAGSIESIENSYASGNVVCDLNGANFVYYVGELAGQVTSLENVYAVECSDVLFGTEDYIENQIVQSLTKEEALSSGSYVGFDFENVWMTEAFCGDELIVTYDDGLVQGMGFESIKLVDSNGNKVKTNVSLGLQTLHIKATEDLVEGEVYTAIIPVAAIQNNLGSNNVRKEISFIYRSNPTVETEHKLVVDQEIVDQRDTVTQEEIKEFWSHFVDDGLNTRFYSNVILNRLNDDDVSKWLRIYGKETSDYTTVSYGGNYWGTLDKELINLQIVDFEDYGGFEDVNIGIYDEIPTDTYPFVVNAYLEVNGEQVDTVGNQEVTFVVEFNRDMDTTIPLDVKFGSYYPYADYKVEGEYVNAKTWKGTMHLTTIIENGYQYWSVSNGKAANTSYKLYTDWGRFPFMIDTSSAQALLMQAEVTNKGINLTWTQDDFETLAGYNVYRSTSEDGYYTRINPTLIPADTKEWFDDKVEPGQKYYYNFTVLKTDLTESEPSGKVSVTALDTMAPDIYHTPIYEAFTGSNLVVSASVTDNIGIKEAKVYYRAVGSETYSYADMLCANDRFTAIIPSEIITTEGVEYYIEASDGVSYTYKGTATEPYIISVKPAVSASELGDVDGNGVIELADAMKLLYTINDKYNMTAEEFARADLNSNGVLGAEEALRIIQYVNGTVSDLKIG